MSKKRHRKVRPKKQRHSSLAKTVIPVWQWMILLILPFILYLNTFGFDYAQDDAIVITENTYTQQGLEGIDDILLNETFVGYFQRQKDLLQGGRYRPLSLVTFALEMEIFPGGNPGFSHIINTFLYAITGLFLFFLLFRMFEYHRFKPYQGVIPFLAAALFLIHPIHTEAVANIKGRDEILSLLFCLATLMLLLGYHDFPKKRYLAGSLITYFLALLSKENAYTFVAVIPLTFYFFTDLEPARIVKYFLYPLIVAVLAFSLRVYILGGTGSGVQSNELMNEPFLGTTFSGKLATITFTLGKYLQLLIIPHTLTHDYYPYHIEIMEWSDPLVFISALTYLILIWAAIRGLKRKSLVAYGIWFYLITIFIVSNLPVSVGVFMSERFAFMPSVGFCLVLTFALVHINGWLVLQKTHVAKGWQSNFLKWGSWIRYFIQKQSLGFFLVVLITLAFCFKTVDRNEVWKNNEELFLTDVETSANSAKVNNAAGGALFEKAMSTRNEVEKRQYLTRSRQYISKALEIHPGYGTAWATYGSILYYLEGDIEGAMESFLKSGSAQDYQNLLAMANMEIQKENFESAIRILESFLEVRPRHDLALTKLGLAYARGRQDLQKALELFRKAVSINPANAEALENIGVAYAFQNRHGEAIPYFEQALRLNPNNKSLMINLAIAYEATGNMEKARLYRQRAGEGF